MHGVVVQLLDWLHVFLQFANNLGEFFIQPLAVVVLEYGDNSAPAVVTAYVLTWLGLADKSLLSIMIGPTLAFLLILWIYRWTTRIAFDFIVPGLSNFGIG